MTDSNTHGGDPECTGSFVHHYFHLCERVSAVKLIGLRYPIEKLINEYEDEALAEIEGFDDVENKELYKKGLSEAVLKVRGLRSHDYETGFQLELCSFVRPSRHIPPRGPRRYNSILLAEFVRSNVETSDDRRLDHITRGIVATEVKESG